MDEDREQGFASNHPSRVTEAQDISFDWKLGEERPLEFNPLSPELFQILNRRTPAFHEIMNESPVSSFDTNVLRTGKTVAGQIQWEEVSNTAERSEFAGSFDPLNRFES